jgi:hypothetical protein
LCKKFSDIIKGNKERVSMKQLTAFVVLLIGLASVNACTTPASLEASQPATLTKLDQKFSVFARLGDLPVPLKEKDPVATFAIAPKGHSPEYLIMIAPALAEGKVEIPLKDTGDAIESALQYNKYLDLVLRAHRLILRGRLKEAKSLLEDLDKLYEVTFGSLVLKGNIAVLEHRWEDAAHAFDLASRVNPQAKSVSGLATRSTQ